MPGELHPTVATALNKFAATFGWELLRFPQGDTSGFSRSDLSVHGYFRFPRYGEPEPEFSAAHRFLEQEGVMLLRYSRQDGKTNYFVAPIIPVPLTTAYHSTPRKHWSRIEGEGLLPGDPAKGRATTGQRFDCEGYIFVCRDLGTPEDAGRPYAYSAHWWRDHLACMSGDPDWVILRLDRLDTIPGLVTNRDVCSDSGVVLSGVDRIPPDCLILAWLTSMREIGNPQVHHPE